MAIQYPNNGNPFLARLNQLSQTQGNSTPAAGVNPAQMRAALGAAAGQNVPPQSVPTNPAQAVPQGPAGAQAGPQGGATKTLMAAMQALHQFTQQGADQQEVAVVRSMIVILNQLIQRDQMKAQQGGQGGEQPTPQTPQGAGPQISATQGQAALG